MDIDPRVPLRVLGFSSLMALELTNCLATNLRRSLSDTLLWTYPTIAELAAHLADETGKAAVNMEEPQRQTHKVALHGATILDNLENLSDEEAEALLKKKVEGKL